MYCTAGFEVLQPQRCTILTCCRVLCSFGSSALGLQVSNKRVADTLMCLRLLDPPQVDARGKNQAFVAGHSHTSLRLIWQSPLECVSLLAVAGQVVYRQPENKRRTSDEMGFSRNKV